MSEVEPGLLRRIEAIAETAGEPADTGEVARAISALRAELGAVREALEERMAALEDTLDTEATAVDTLATSVREALGELAAAVDRSLGGLGGSVAGALSEARDKDRRHVEAAVAEVRDLVTETRGGLAAELRDSLARIEAAAAASRAFVEEEVAALRADLADALEEVRDGVTASIAQQLGGFAGVGTAVERLNAETATALDEMRVSLDEAVDSVRAAAGSLSDGTDRLASAGRGLLGYLADRERALEAERDRVLHDLLDEFAEGLSAKDRRWLSGRLGDALERRRDLRDAERWRKADAERTLPEAPEPPDPAVYDAPPREQGAKEPAAPVKAAEAPVKKAAAAKPTPAKKAAAAKPTPAKKAAAGAAPRRRRASVGAVPDVPSPDVAVDAAASPAGPTEPAGPAEQGADHAV